MRSQYTVRGVRHIGDATHEFAAPVEADTEEQAREQVTEELSEADGDFEIHEVTRI